MKMLKKVILVFIVLLLNSMTYGQKKKPFLQNIQSYIITASDTIKIQRYNSTEYHKLIDIGSKSSNTVTNYNLVDAVMSIESYLEARSNGEIPNDTTEIERRFNKLNNLAKVYKLYFYLENYRKESIYYANHPLKNETEKTLEEKLKEWDAKQNEKMQKDIDFKNKNIAYNIAIQRRNDSISTIERRQRLINDSIENIKQKLEIKKQIAVNVKQKKYVSETKVKRKLENEKKVNERRKEIINKYGVANGEAILNHKVKIGWTKSMCIASWGKPYDINRTTNAYVVFEQYVYSLKKYLYFENGVLTSIQD